MVCYSNRKHSKVNKEKVCRGWGPVGPRRKRWGSSPHAVLQNMLNSPSNDVTTHMGGYGNHRKLPWAWVSRVQLLQGGGWSFTRQRVIWGGAGSVTQQTVHMWLTSITDTQDPQKRTSLVAQGLRIHLPVQGTWVWTLVQEDPTCHGATKPVRHNYWACALEPASHNYWAHAPRACEPQLLKPMHLEPMLRNKRSHCNEKPMYHNETPTLASTRESLRAAMKTQRSQK